MTCRPVTRSRTRSAPACEVGAVREVLAGSISSYVDDRAMAEALKYLLGRFRDSDVVALADQLLDGAMSPDDLARELCRIQRETVRASIDAARKTIVLLYPTPTYREHIAGLADLLRASGFNVVIALGVVCGDRFERDAQAYYAGTLGSLSLIEAWDFVDLVVTPVLATELPPRAKRVYVLHDIHASPLGDERAVSDIAGRLCAYDYVYAPSPPVVDVFARLLASQTTDARRTRIVPGGYMKLDRFIADFAAHRRDAKSIVYAPTVTGYGLEGVGSLAAMGDAIVGTLLAAAPDHEVIFRPHPHTLGTREVQDIVDRYRSHPRFTLDANASSYSDTYARARFMVSDISGTAFTYALATLRPVIFCSFNEEEVQRRFGHLRYVHDRHRIGSVVHDLSQLSAAVCRLLGADPTSVSGVEAYRRELLFNPGLAHEYFVGQCPTFIAGGTGPGWVER